MRRSPLALVVLALLVSSAAAAPARRTTSQRAPAHVTRPFKRGLAPLPETSLVRIRGKAHLDASAYKDISAATQHLLAKYPPATHYFVGLGRDPAPIIAFLQNLGGKDLAVNFPASSNEADAATKEILARYVAKIIPEHVLASGRTIVFVDATTSGRALDHYVPLIKPSLRGAKVIKAAFAIGGLESRAARFRGNKQIIDTAPFPEVDKFFTDPYEDAVAEFPRHGPGTHRFSVLDKPRPQYQQFRDALMQRMQRDESLDGFLAKKAGK